MKNQGRSSLSRVLSVSTCGRMGISASCIPTAALGRQTRRAQLWLPSWRRGFSRLRVIRRIVEAAAANHAWTRIANIGLGRNSKDIPTMTANPPNSTSSRAQSQYPKPSLQSRPILERLSNSAARTLRPDSLLLEELLTSLKKDQFVLQMLREELRRYRDGKVSPELVSRAAVRVEQLENECDLLGANAALMCGATAKATLLLRGLIQKDSSNLAESSRPLLFKLLISIAWVVEDASVAETFLQRAATEDQQGDYAQYLAGVNRLLQARAELRQKKPDAAVRLCQAMGRETRPDDPLRILALELQADAFRQLGDEKREQDVLEDWEGLLKRLPNGPCDLAVEAETTTTAPGISGGPRSHEILEHFSRLAFHFERNSDTRNYAKGILTKFLNTAQHEWIDPNQPVAGTIRERMARLESPPRNLH